MTSTSKKTTLLILSILVLASIGAGQGYDVILRGGMVYDGSGKAPFRKDIGIRGDRIVEIGDLSKKTAPLVIDATSMAVAPGFINMLSHSMQTLVRDPRS